MIDYGVKNQILPRILAVVEMIMLYRHSSSQLHWDEESFLL